MKISITTEFDEDDYPCQSKQIIHAGDMAYTLTHALERIRFWLKHSDEEMSDNEIRRLEELQDLLYIDGIQE